ncbi:MAG TPA: aminotransferase class V-fold PLP-dependent enzyme [Bryobacteraceae bacterium]|nr:aminotransferase class V-fold PLP-dependent enzyme [Bryobacteraceae bacterium]
MTPRRSFLKSLAAPAISAPLLSGAAFADKPSASAIPPLPRPDDPAYWTKIRDQFLLARDKVFFNNGTIGAMPKVVFEKVVEHLRKMATDLADWDYQGEEWISGYSPMESVRAKAARLINCDVSEIGLTENVSCANSYVATGLDLESGSEILMSDQEHTGGESPWFNAAKRRGGTVTKIKINRPVHDRDEVLYQVLSAISPRTRVIFLSHMITGSGAILPVKEISAAARDRGILTVLDGAQTVGQIPVDVRDIGCDAYVACFHKWLLAPAGCGFVYLRKDFANRVWTTLASRQWDNHEDNGYRLTQRGTGSMSLMMGVEAALDFHFNLGPERVQKRIQQLGDQLREGLRKIPRIKIYSPDDNSMCAGITVYGVEGIGAQQLQDEMWKRGRLRPRANTGGVRHCTHIFNSPEEIDRALSIVRTLAA